MHDDELTAFAAAFLDIRHSRCEDFPGGMFSAGGAWDILLTLFVADARGSRMTARTAISESGENQEVGRRWIKFLTARDLVVGDGDGRLDDVVTLTPLGLDLLERWVRRARAILVKAQPVVY